MNTIIKDVVGLSAAAISMIFLIARIWDGIKEPSDVCQMARNIFRRFATRVQNQMKQ